jgi:hypothetical protein
LPNSTTSDGVPPKTIVNQIDTHSLKFDKLQGITTAITKFPTRMAVDSGRRGDCYRIE